MSLSLTLIIVSSLVGFYRLISHAYDMTDYQEDIYIAAKQVSQYVIGTKYIDVGTKYTYVDLQGQEMTFLYDDHRLVKTPGFEILLTDIDDLFFEIENQQIYMNLERKNINYKFLIAYARKHDEIENTEVE